MRKSRRYKLKNSIHILHLNFRQFHYPSNKILNKFILPEIFNPQSVFYIIKVLTIDLKFLLIPVKYFKILSDSILVHVLASD